jgi:hypothetical protein
LIDFSSLPSDKDLLKGMSTKLITEKDIYNNISNIPRNTRQLLNLVLALKTGSGQLRVAKTQLLSNLKLHLLRRKLEQQVRNRY